MYNQRIKIFLAIIGVVFLVVIARLWYLQLVLGADYRAEITQKLQRDDMLPAGRGHIMDRHGAILACDEPCFDLCLDYRQLFLWVNGDPNNPSADPNHPFAAQARSWRRRQINAIRRSLRPAGDPASMDLALTQASEIYSRRERNTRKLLQDYAGADLDEVCRRIYNRVEALRGPLGRRSPIEQTQRHVIVSGLDDAAAVAVKSQMYDLVGLDVRPSFKRRYPYRNLACHIIGYTGKVSDKEPNAYNLRLDQADELTCEMINYGPEDTIGKAGVERLCEGLPLRRLDGNEQAPWLNDASLAEIDTHLGLRGRRGMLKRHRLTGATFEEIPAVQGQDVHLTLDIMLQDDLTQLFPPGVTGSIVVLSVPRGEVLAMVSVPTYDLNNFRQEYAQLVKDETYFPLRHRAVSQLYPPGSTAKPVVALAGLGSGVITTDYTRDCTGYLFSNVTNAWRCWTVASGMPGHGPLNVTGALKNSCNVFFYHLGELLGAGRMPAWFEMFGFNSPPGTGLPEERAGRYPDKPDDGACRLMGIGQGKLQITPLHVANAMATIARGGEFRSPILMLEGAGHAQVSQRLPLTEAQVAAVKRGMWEVCNESGGTAYKVFHGDFDPLGVEVCGKTGTADIQALKNNDGVDRTGNMAWFSGFAPADNPQIAIAVVIEYVEGHGATYAGPAAREAIRACIQRGYVTAKDQGPGNRE
ncbi:MAG: penicillin-binding transpeptidase domain-containing protein [Phycisphaerae bacterium]|jgi:penicillin-binding protein 2